MIADEPIHGNTKQTYPTHKKKRHNYEKLDLEGKDYSLFFGNQIALSPLTGYQATLSVENGGFEGFGFDLSEHIQFTLDNDQWTQPQDRDNSMIFIRDIVKSQSSEYTLRINKLHAVFILAFDRFIKCKRSDTNNGVE